MIPGKAVVGVEQDDSGVKVSCADGSVYEGDIVVGCDGVHSAIRRLAIEGQRVEKTSKEMKIAAMPLQCEYRCMFGSGPRPDGNPECPMVETHSQGLCFQILSSEERVYWLVYDERQKSVEHENAEATPLHHDRNRTPKPPSCPHAFWTCTPPRLAQPPAHIPHTHRD